MIAAIYARKSTEQNGVGDEEKSVARQIQHGKAYAARKAGRSIKRTFTRTTVFLAPSSRSGQDFYGC